jgi:RNA polymerase-binding transcription factor DksA
VADREPGDVQFDDEGGEGDSIAVERDFDLHRAAAALGVIEEIDAALLRIKDGSYGICESSGLRIPKERLQAIPWARERVEIRTRSFR